MTQWGIAFGTKTTTTIAYRRKENKLTFKRIPFQLPPLQVFSKLHENYDNVYFLESIEGPRKLVRYSFIGFDPELIMRFKNGKAKIRNERTGEETLEESKNPLDEIQKLVKDRAIYNKELGFTGGAVGYFSYDAIRYWEKLPETARDDLNFPDAEFGFFDDGIVFDHRKKCAFYYYSIEDRLSEIEKAVKQQDTLNVFT